MNGDVISGHISPFLWQSRERFERLISIFFVFDAGKVLDMIMIKVTDNGRAI